MILKIILLLPFIAFSKNKEITTSLPPLAHITKSLVDDNIKVSSLMNINDDPHSFEPTALQLQSTSNSALYFHCGMNFQESITSRMKMRFPSLEIVNLSMVVPEQQRNHDPHVWLSLITLEKMAVLMAKHIIEKFPHLKNQVENNLKSLTTNLQTKHKNIAEKLIPLKGKTFYVYHPAFGYFASDYKMIQKSVEIDGKTPSPKQLLGLIAQAKTDGVKTILVQPQFNRKPAEIIAKRINGNVIAINPLADDPIKEIENIANALINAHKE